MLTASLVELGLAVAALAQYRKTSAPMGRCQSGYPFVNRTNKLTRAASMTSVVTESSLRASANEVTEGRAVV